MAIKGEIESKTEEYQTAVTKKLESANQDRESFNSVWGIFQRMIPQNVFDAFGNNGQMLALIFVSLLTGFGLLSIHETSRQSLLSFFTALNELMLLVTNWIMWFAPIGVFALVGKVVGESGFEIFRFVRQIFPRRLARLIAAPFCRLADDFEVRRKSQSGATFHGHAQRDSHRLFNLVVFRHVARNVACDSRKRREFRTESRVSSSHLVRP